MNLSVLFVNAKDFSAGCSNISLTSTLSIIYFILIKAHSAMVAMMLVAIVTIAISGCLSTCYISNLH